MSLKLRLSAKPIPMLTTALSAVVDIATLPEPVIIGVTEGTTFKSECGKSEVIGSAKQIRNNRDKQ